MGVLHSFFIKNIFYDKMDLELFYFDVAIYNQFFLEWNIESQTLGHQTFTISWVSFLLLAFRQFL